jgi:hypothetical protein
MAPAPRSLMVRAAAPYGYATYIAYPVFGIFLVLTFGLYLLGMVSVLGADLNAIMREPPRASHLPKPPSRDSAARLFSISGRE